MHDTAELAELAEGAPARPAERSRWIALLGAVSVALLAGFIRLLDRRRPGRGRHRGRRGRAAARRLKQRPRRAGPLIGPMPDNLARRAW